MENTVTNNAVVAKPEAKPFPARKPADNRGPQRGGAGRSFGGGNSRGGKPGDRNSNPRRGGAKRPERQKSEFEHKIISIRRVTRVVSGGRRFSFSVGIVAGDKKGRVGVGMGKASDTALAIDKALRDAEKNMLKLKLTKTNSIPREVEAKFASSRVLIMPAPERGLIAGSSVRTVLELGGIKDVGAKIFSRSKNKINNARVAIAALSKLS